MAVEGLAGANLLVGVLNLVPGLPLDGGRVLKAVVWGVTGNPHRGTIVAGWGGRLAAVAVLAWPLVQYALLDEPTRRSSTSSWRSWSRSSCGPAPPRRWPRPGSAAGCRRWWPATSPGVPSPSPTTCPLAEAVRRAQEAEAGSIVTVTSGGQPVGIVSEAALLATPEDRRPWVAVSTVARTVEDGLRLPARSRARS